MKDTLDDVNLISSVLREIADRNKIQQKSLVRCEYASNYVCCNQDTVIKFI